MMQVMVQWKEYVVTSALVFGCTASTSEILLGQQQCLQCSSADFHTSTLCSSAECGSVEDMETIVQVISVNENPVIRLLQISSLSDKKNHWFHCRLFCKTIEWTQSPWRWPALRKKWGFQKQKGLWLIMIQTLYKHMILHSATKRLDRKLPRDRICN